MCFNLGSILRAILPLGLLGLFCLFLPLEARAQTSHQVSKACESLLPAASNANRSDQNAIQQCVADLPKFEPSQQITFANRYVRAGYRFLTPDIRAPLVRKMVPEAARKLSSAGAWVEASNNKEGSAETIAKLLQNARRANDELSIASLKLAEAYLAMHQQDYDAMKSLSDEALILADQNNMSGFKPVIFTLLSMHAQRTGNVQDAVRLLGDAFDGYWAIEARGRASRTCSRLGLLYSNVPNISTEDLDETIERAAQDQDPKLACYYLAAGNFNYRQQKQAKPYLERSLNLAESEQLAGMRPLLLNILAAAALYKKEYAEAIDFYERALGLYQESQQYSRIAGIYNGIGIVFSELGEYERALEFYQNGIDILQEHQPDNVRTYALLLGNVGATYNKMGQYEAAIDYFDQARAQNEKIKGRVANDAFINRYYAEALHGLGQTEPAMTMAATAADQFLDGNQVSQAGATLSWLGARYLEQNDISKAQAILARAREAIDPESQGPQVLLDFEGDDFWHMDYAKNMATLLMALDRPDMALAYSQVAMTLSEKRFDDDKIKAVANMDVMFKLRDRERDLELLRQQALLSDLGLRQSRAHTIAWFLMAIFTGLIALLFYRLYRSQRKLATTRDIFLSEIHHRTKNNLQVLSSLLSIDARRNNNGSVASNRQTDAANRARIMALVHDHIYNQNKTTSTKIEVRKFLIELIDLLQESLGRDNIELKTDIVEAMVDVDRITPLGLIVCELVSNAYKHAFEEEGGTILVALTGKIGNLILVVSDNGKGFDYSGDADKEESLGVMLVNELSAQINGKMDVTTSSSGTVWTLSKVGTPGDRIGAAHSEFKRYT